MKKARPVTLGLDSRPRPHHVSAAAAGLAILLGGGVLSALLAARWLEPSEYTVFAAFSAVFGLAVLGPASSLEQAAALTRGRLQSTGRHLLMGKLARQSVALWFLATLIALVPVAAWQERLWGTTTPLVQVIIILTVPPIFLLAITRGLAAARGEHGYIGSVFAIAGVGNVALPPLLYLLGTPVLPAFLLGTGLAWLPPLLTLVWYPRMRPAAPVPEGDRSESSPVTVLIVTGNLLVLGNLLAVPALLRWHIQSLDVANVADVQLLVSISRLSTTASLGFVPLAVARLASARSGQTWQAARPLLGVACGLGTAAVLTSALLGDAFISWVTGRATEVPQLTILLAALPVAALCPAIVLTAAAIATGRHRLLLLSWTLGLIALTGTLFLAPDGDINKVLIGVLVAGACPGIVLSIGFLQGVRRSQARGAVS